MRARRRALRAALVAILVVTGLPLTGAKAQLSEPTLELRSATSFVRAARPKGTPVYLDLGTYVAAIGGQFEIWVTRPDYAQPVVVQRALYNPAGNPTFQDIPVEMIDSWYGFRDFMRIDISQSGELVKSKKMGFCPNSYDRQRVNDEGPDTFSYPDGCYGNPFTKGLVWGIDEGWAVNPASSYGGTVMRLPEGLYDVTVSIEQAYVDLFDVPADKSSVQLQLKVRTSRGFPGCPDCPHPIPHQYRRTYSSSALPIVTDPDPATLPDLIALPAWGIFPMNEGGRDYLTFGANIWTAGAQSLVVEGFRAEGEERMDAFQYFYENGEPVARAPVGEMAYHNQPGHRHWHFLQFARYSLLDATQTEIVLSQKQAFCLAPTDAIDLTLENAEWAPYLGGLGTACGGRNALWVREVLPLGWGDTYFQGIPGQSFDITDVPNGTYYIEVEANPGQLLYEQTPDNNVELREVILSGKPGNRRVEVPPWNGIDTENIYGGGGESGA
jgi:Lysyl oxidase